jgi:tRNA G10  N-methylase Trm11
MYIAILGRQPSLSLAELERVYGSDTVTLFSSVAAVIKTDDFSIARLGGTLKAGLIVAELSGDWRRVGERIVSEYSKAWAKQTGKITLGISLYGFEATPREIQRPGIILKSALKKSGVSLRLIPNNEPALNTATSHHNKLGLSSNKVELMIIRGKNGKVIIAESTGAQNITALARRDQGRPKRDAFVGMLPPKLAQIIVNLAVGDIKPANHQLLDPFCGTGVVLQEAALMGFDVCGTDLSEKMIDYSKANLEWLADTHHVSTQVSLKADDAMDAVWQPPISAVACETYLGQAFSAPPSSIKLTEVRRNCDHIVSTFLKNISPQLASGTPLCVAVPAWRGLDGRLTHLPLVERLDELGFSSHRFKHVVPSDLVYFRDDQVVARELLVLTKK